MKKFFSILAAFFLGLFISIGIIACADNDNDDDSSLGQLSWAEFRELRNARILNVKYLGGDVKDNLEYKFDDKGRISAVYRNTTDAEYNFSDTFHVTYSGNTIIIMDEGEESERYEITVSEGAMKVPFVVNEFVRDYIDN